MDDDYYGDGDGDGQREMFALKHEPLQPVRKGVGEQVFSRRWKRLMEAHGAAFDQVLGDYSASAGQREASVVASVVTWLGTNIGQSLLDSAAGRQAENPPPGWTARAYASDAYLGAWAHANRRVRSINFGARALESILLYARGPAHDELSARDYEVAEHLMHWLGQAEGQEFLAGCKAERTAVAMIQGYATIRALGVDDQGADRMREGDLQRWAEAGEVAAAAYEAVIAQFGALDVKVAVSAA